VGGTAWKTWNEAIRTAVIDHQLEDGSWEPFGSHAEALGRIGTTALLTMTMQVYYRYTRIFPTR